MRGNPETDCFIPVWTAVGRVFSCSMLRNTQQAELSAENIAWDVRY